MTRDVDLNSLETVIYDNGCNLDAYILNREPRLGKVKIYNLHTTSGHVCLALGPFPEICLLKSFITNLDMQENSCNQYCCMQYGMEELVPRGTRNR